MASTSGDDGADAVAAHARTAVHGPQPTPVLLERDAELVRIGGMVEAAVSGQGCLTVIEGPAGIGKTSLVAAARPAARTAGLTPLRARGGELEQAFPFGVALQLYGLYWLLAG